MKRNILTIIFLLIVAFTVSSCVSTKSLDGTSVGSSILGEGKGHASIGGSSHTVVGHRYAFASSIDELKSFNYMVTYVLLPLQKSSLNKDKVAKRYKKTLKLIQESLKIGINSSETESIDYNKFIIMTNQNQKKKVDIDTYNYNLSVEVIDFFRKRFKKMPFYNDGPFLITTIDRPFDGSEKFTFLYVNLSAFDDSGINEVLKSYKKKLVQKGNSQFTILENMKFKLLSLSMHGHDDIRDVVNIFATKLYAGE